MRKRPRKRKKLNPQRHTTAITKRKPLLRIPRIEYSPIEDHRRHTPKRARLYYDIKGKEVDYALKDAKGTYPGASQTKATVSFADPRSTIVCRRRSERRKSLFALKKVGKGRRTFKKRKMRPESKIRCT